MSSDSEHPSTPGPTTGPTGVELDRPDRFPEVEEPPAPTSVGMIAVQFFVAPLGIALAAIAVFVLASVVTSRESKGVGDILRKIRDGGRNERTQAAFDLAQYINANRTKITAQEKGQIVGLFENRLQRARDPKSETTEGDRTTLRFLALCVGQLDDPRAGDLLVSALSSDDSELKANALYGIGRLQQVRHVNEIVQLLIAPDEDETVRSVSAWVLGSLLRTDAPPSSTGDASWAESLERGRDALMLAARKSGGSPTVRWNSTVALGQTGDPRAVPLLLPLLDLDAVKQLPLSSTPQPGQGSASGLGRDRERAMEQAVKVAGMLRDRALIPALEKLAAQSESASLAIQAKQAMDAIRFGNKGAGSQ